MPDGPEHDQLRDMRQGGGCGCGRKRFAAVWSVQEGALLWQGLSGGGLEGSQAILSEVKLTCLDMLMLLKVEVALLCGASQRSYSFCNFVPPMLCLERYTHIPYTSQDRTASPIPPCLFAKKPRCPLVGCRAKVLHYPSGTTSPDRRNRVPACRLYQA